MLDREKRLEAALHAVYELDGALRAVAERLNQVAVIDPGTEAALKLAEGALLRAEVVLAGGKPRHDEDAPKEPLQKPVEDVPGEPDEEYEDDPLDEPVPARPAVEEPGIAVPKRSPREEVVPEPRATNVTVASSNTRLAELQNRSRRLSADLTRGHGQR
jgi:hypothetical protein